MTNQYALGFKACQEAAVKVAIEYAESTIEEEVEALQALPVPEVQWRDLTDDEIKAAYESWWEEHGNHAFPIWVGAKAVIAKFKEKQL